MPVRSLTSSVLTWPDARTVQQAARRWAEEAAQQRPEVLRVGYFGSYARGDWGVGSDLDLIVVVQHAAEPFMPRATRWDTTGLPVPADVLVYTVDEWRAVRPESRFGKMLMTETVWLYDGAAHPSGDHAQRADR